MSFSVSLWETAWCGTYRLSDPLVTHLHLIKAWLLKIKLFAWSKALNTSPTNCAVHYFYSSLVLSPKLQNMLLDACLRQKEKAKCSQQQWTLFFFEVLSTSCSHWLLKWHLWIPNTFEKSSYSNIALRTGKSHNIVLRIFSNTCLNVFKCFLPEYCAVWKTPVSFKWMRHVLLWISLV